MRSTHAGRRQVRRLTIAAGAIGLLVAGCVTTYVIRPETGEPVGVASGKGLELAADPEAWDARPYDLTDYMTPIAVHIANGSGTAVAVRYEGFALVDDHGFRYAAIDPFGRQRRTRFVPRDGDNNQQEGDGEGSLEERSAPDPGASRQPPGDEEPAGDGADEPERPKEDGNDPGDGGQGPDGQQQTEPTSGDLTRVSGSGAGNARAAGVLLAYAGDVRNLRLAPQRRDTLVAQRRVRRYSRGFAGHRSRVIVRRGRGFYVYPRVGVYFDYYTPWPGPYFYYPPPYPGYVYVWGPPYYHGPPPADVRRLALPEGVLKPGGEVSGFLYFRNARRHVQHLMLVWKVRTPKGQPVTTLRVPFVIVPG